MSAARRSRDEGDARRFVVRFLAVLVLLYTAYAFTKQSAPFHAHRVALAVLAEALLAPFYGDVARVGNELLAPVQLGVRVVEGCDAIYALLCFVGGVVAFRSTWRQKLVGLALGLVAIELLNVLRIASLFAIQRHRPDWFHTLHTTVWESVFVLAAVVLWAGWAMRVSRRAGATSGDAPEERVAAS